jgi:CheY-like chemotaxis protein
MRTILLVENDPLQAFVRKAVLEKQFSDVRRVADAAEALCLVEQPPFAESLGLVVAGHHLTGIDGPAFVAELHTRMPALPVLVLGDGEAASNDYAGAQVRYLRKPFTSDEVLAAAGQMLAQSARKTA